jgi:hypothetical protein
LTGPEFPEGWADTKIETYRIREPEFCEAYGIGPRGLVLIRPDGFVAWRAKEVEIGRGAAENFQRIYQKELGRTA